MSTIRDPAYITDAGRTMMTTGGDVTYTKAVLYGQDISHLTSDQVKALTTIGILHVCGGDPVVGVPWLSRNSYSPRMWR